MTSVRDYPLSIAFLAVVAVVALIMFALGVR